MRRGEIRWYRFAAPDKRRPSRASGGERGVEFLGEVTIAPVTSTIRDIPTEVVLGRDDGMSKDCAVNLDHLHTVAKAKIGGLVTTLRASRMAEVRAALLFALGFPR